MAALSSDDKLRLRLSAARVERWNRQRMLPPKPRDEPIGNAWANGQDKPQEIIKPDRLAELQRHTDGFAVRSMSGKLGNHSNAIAARVHSISHTDPDTGKVTTQVVHSQEDGYMPPDSVLGGRTKNVRLYKPAHEQAPLPVKGKGFKKTITMPQVVVIKRKGI